MTKRNSSRDTDTPAEQQPLAGIALRLLTALLLAIMFALVKLASTRGVNVIESLFYRQCGSALCATGLVAAGPGFSSLRTQRVWAHVARMALGIGAMGLNFLAFILLPLAEATTIGFSVPIFSVILAALLLDEPTGRWRWGAVAAGFAGVLLIVQPGNGEVPLLGASVALAGALMTASVTIVIRRLGKTERAATTVFWFAISSLVPLGLAMLIFGGVHDRGTWMMLAGLALVSALLAGYQSASEKAPTWLHQIGFAAIVALTVYVILDIEFPRLGWVRLDAIDQLLVAQRASMQ